MVRVRLDSFDGSSLNGIRSRVPTHSLQMPISDDMNSFSQETWIMYLLILTFQGLPQEIMEYLMLRSSINSRKKHLDVSSLDFSNITRQVATISQKVEKIYSHE